MLPICSRVILLSFVLLSLVFAIGDGEVARADTLDEILQRGTLIWGGDAEGGGPYVYPDAADPRRLRGFEFELAQLLARRLGVEARFAQGQWDKLPDLLSRGDIDIVLNGYEYRPVWADRYGISVPYYVYELQLLARAEDTSLRSLAELRASPGSPRKRVAVLGGSAAQSYVEDRFGDDVELVLFDGVTDAMRAVELATDGIDATLQDLPIVSFYEDGFPGLSRVDQPVGTGYYVILVRSEDERLLKALNEAIIASLRDGSLRQILERYDLWNQAQQQRALETDESGDFVLTAIAEPEEGSAQLEQYAPVRGWSVLWQRAPLLLAGAWMTVKLSVVAMPLAVIAGLTIALLRLYGPRLLGKLLVLYVEIVRGTPLVLQLYVIFFLLPETGLSIDAFWAAILGLAINYSAYEAEIYRAGLQAIPRGQMEAALALGMSRSLALRRVIVPQATRLVIPPVTNDFIALFKDTAVCSLITVVELSKQYYIHARSTGAVVELGILTAILYLGMSYPLALFTNHMERRLRTERLA